jgi:hypothetical protein
MLFFIICFLPCIFIATREMKIRDLMIILILHFVLSMTVYVKYSLDYKEACDEYVNYAYEQYAIDEFFGRTGDQSSWPYRVDPEAKKLEDRIDNLRLILFGATTLDILLLLYVGTTYKSRYR